MHAESNFLIRLWASRPDRDQDSKHQNPICDTRVWGRDQNFEKIGSQDISRPRLKVSKTPSWVLLKKSHRFSQLTVRST